nr:Arm DNA-binding domain-containing protein [Bacillus nitratireducens]
MKRSVKKDKKTGKYFYIVHIGIDPLTGKRKQKKEKGIYYQKRSRKYFNKAAFRSSYWHIRRT